MRLQVTKLKVLYTSSASSRETVFLISSGNYPNCHTKSNGQRQKSGKTSVADNRGRTSENCQRGTRAWWSAARSRSYGRSSRDVDDNATGRSGRWWYSCGTRWTWTSQSKLEKDVTFQLVQLLCCGEIRGSTIGLEASQNELFRSRRTEACKVGKTDANLFSATNNASIRNRRSLTTSQDSNECKCCQWEYFHDACKKKRQDRIVVTDGRVCENVDNDGRTSGLMFSHQIRNLGN